MSRFQRLLTAATVAVFALIGVGGLVRATGSGLGCTGWPKCSAESFLPPIEYHALIEYSHRMIATIAVVLIALVAIAAWRSHRHEPRILWPSIGAAALVVFQAVLGGIVVHGDLEATLVTAHFATAMLLAGVLVHLLTASFFADATRSSRFARLTRVTAAATFALLLVGAYVRGAGAGLAFRDWPLMNGRLAPALGGIATPMFLHRVLAAAVVLLVIYAAIRVRTLPGHPRVLVRLSNVLLALFVAQVLAGAVNVWTRLSPAAVVLHVTLSALVWGAVVALATASGRVALEPAASERAEKAALGSLHETTVAYFQLTKPRIIVLLLVTTLPTMVLAAGRVPSVLLIIATLAGGTLAAGSANAINCYLDRDIDEIMRRTRKRPVPSHRVTPDQALAFGFVLGAISFFFLSMTVNVVAAALALAAIAFYVFVYTLWLKRSTAQNIVIGGAAGAAPVLVGWAAVTGTVALPALVLFAIIFVWTPPHFWALSMQYRNDYAAAGVPMLPVVRGREETLWQILLYSLALFAVTLVLYPVAHMGPVYVAAAVVLGGSFVYRALRLRTSYSQAAAMRLFRFSIVYLALLFAAVAADRLI